MALCRIEIETNVQCIHSHTKRHTTPTDDDDATDDGGMARGRTAIGGRDRRARADDDASDGGGGDAFETTRARQRTEVWTHARARWDDVVAGVDGARVGRVVDDVVARRRGIERDGDRWVDGGSDDARVGDFGVRGGVRGERRLRYAVRRRGEAE
jgi:hypothetical protein